LEFRLADKVCFARTGNLTNIFSPPTNVDMIFSVSTLARDV
jgi:hypothetical protein